jgi:hypothetical protein
MHQHIPTALVMTTLFFAGCSTPDRGHRTALLTLPYNEFDQAYGDGWRSFYEAGDVRTAVALLEDYLKLHPDLTFPQRKFLHLHAGQLLALQGRNPQAVKHLEKAMSHQKSPELWPDWDDFITATKAFLTQDRPTLLAARERLAAAKAPRVKLADRFIQKFGQSYADVIWWIPVCFSVAIPDGAPAKQRAAAARLAKALGCSVTVGETNSPSCCIWLQLRPFSPKAVPQGYVIAHFADGTLITASDAGWLDAAVQRFIKSSRQNHGSWEAPIGIVSNIEPNPQANLRLRQHK